MLNLKDNIKETYHKFFETDELWEELKENLTFEDLLNSMQKGEDVYETIGVGDSIVRERLFNLLVDILQSMDYDIDYDDIYYCWLDGKPMSLKKKNKD